jgi:predicted alpha/beta-fold hydrolase
MRNNESNFSPHWLIRRARAQTVLSTLCPRSANVILRDERPVILDAGPDYTGYDARVRLLGYYNRHAPESAMEEADRGLVILLHGWEGCSHSTYGVVTAHLLTQAGYDVFRLNLRDHGPDLLVDPYALNRGVFLGTLIEESHAAAQQAALLARGGPVYLVGPSMGGNFALRMALMHAQRPILNLRHVIAINPAIHPAKSIRQLDAMLPFRRYFRQRWLRSLMRKAAHYPDLFDFRPLAQMPKLWQMTEWLVREYTAFASASDYYDSYAVRGGSLRGLTVPTSILTAADDPVIPVSDFYDFEPDPMLSLEIQPAGGHVGFVDLFPFRHRLPEMILRMLARDGLAPNAIALAPGEQAGLASCKPPC